MTKMTRFFSIASLLLLALAAQPAAAQPAPGVLTPDGTSYTVTVSASDTLRVSMDAGDSYCCTALPLENDSNFGFSTSVTGAASITGELKGDVSPVVSVNNTTDTDASDNRLCFEPSTAGAYILSLDSAEAGDGESVRVSCDKTTIAGNFNTNAVDFNFLECTNRSNASVDIKINARNNAGTTVIDGSDSSNQDTLTAGLRKDFDIHTAAGTAQFGPVWVTHDGPKNAIDCFLSQYDGPVSDLTLRGTSRLVPEGN